MILYYESEGTANTVLDLYSVSEAQVTRRIKPSWATFSTLVGELWSKIRPPPAYVTAILNHIKTSTTAALLLHIPRSATSAAKACFLANLSRRCLFHRNWRNNQVQISPAKAISLPDEFPLHVRHRARRLPLEHDRTKCGSQTSFPTYNLLSSLPTAPSEPNHLCRGNMDERTPVHSEGYTYTRRASVSVLSSGSNNEWSKPALLIAIVDLWIFYFRSLACSAS